MWIQPINVTSSNTLMTNYRNQSLEALRNFHYNPFRQDEYTKRFEELNQREFQREELSTHLHQINKEWGASNQTLQNIERLKDSNSVVVVGGQQAGLLTGPLYTIHKIVSIIVMARDQEESLGVPVIPLFWIAGEDHDYDEINHIYMPYSPRMKKFRILQKQLNKSSISDMEMDQQAIQTWLDRLFSQLGESSYTNDLYAMLNQKLESSETFIDFFAQIIFALFDQEGLVLLDSHHPSLRRLESNYFKQMIRQQPAISEGVTQALHYTAQQGYAVNLDADIQDGHLFYTYNQNRVLLVRGEDGTWEGKQGECRLTTDELMEVADHYPEKLSNNVMTRPIMQDLVLPTLAFIGGPGEIGYWSTLKPAFEALDIQMPPVVPRLSLSLLDRTSEKWLSRHLIDVSSAINNGVSEEKNQWISMQSYPPIEQLSDEVKRAIERAHRPLKEKAHEIRDDLGQVAEKNLFYLFRDVEFLQERMEHALEEKHARELQVFDEIDLTLHPEGGLQERIWNILPWVNQYGPELPRRLTELSYDFQQPHHVIYL
ncbi:bacillithiol biosynthesis cysteine-adding enzyme BshC [Pontibacillus yanchengensis]|uniref:Putative cysteine ligase BshC n=1 Tax=Pontibacillus yanchengensis TaxID=462910 RepID=A0A6I5A398_9BACI|nr:bacillithiol biosynthesis cysteine-adding enzyme BshC [Pontibacillus yanchengensis]MYL33039.1 bacillithiol biosynthesis cysteine-adding enzyme BshC [Pontibacillus yanchengensis]